MIKFSSASLVAILLTVQASQVNAATTVTLRPNSSSSATTNGDAFLTTGPSGSLAGNNYGGGGSVAVSAAGSATGEFKSLLRFDVSSAKTTFDATYGVGGWALDSVVLQLTTAAANNAIFNANVVGSFSVQWLAVDLWTEGTGTPAAPSATGVKWNDLATLSVGSETAGTFSLASVADGVTANYTLSAGSGLLGDIGTGGSVTLLLGAADSAVSAVFNSRSFATASRNPGFILTASPVPEPATTAVLGLGLAAGVLRRRRTRSLGSGLSQLP